MGEKRKTNGADDSFTNPIDVTIGAFQSGKFRVPYFSAVISAQSAKDYLKLVIDDPKYAEQDWSVSELFQREISFDRVEEISKNYLNPQHSDRPPFFNSLTVVISPKQNTSSQTFAPPDKHPNYKHHISSGPITISFDKKEQNKKYPAAPSFGILQWNKHEVSAFAIDGQHRLAAIKEALETYNEGLENLSLSILFLIIDPAIGFLVSDKNKFDSTKYMRSIFIDLNKHSVPVSRARNILLDDLDPAALFVWSLVS